MNNQLKGQDVLYCLFGLLIRQQSYVYLDYSAIDKEITPNRFAGVLESFPVNSFIEKAYASGNLVAKLLVKDLFKNQLKNFNKRVSLDQEQSILIHNLPAILDFLGSFIGLSSGKTVNKLLALVDESTLRDFLIENPEVAKEIVALSVINMFIHTILPLCAELKNTYIGNHALNIFKAYLKQWPLFLRSSPSSLQAFFSALSVSISKSVSNGLTKVVDTGFALAANRPTFFRGIALDGAEKLCQVEAKVAISASVSGPR
ncbi:putative L-lactate dehydrogenase [Candidatus Rickettsiella viridis]|uniref:Putative L-lactate dehydrogenase n=1 Tax=Candidatus Rickettsiella viridis TaxID=676208 RepID=A0A2Z5UUF5_9COXI|nr:hypothetical protein [Candidatus Rickettsiella viridis]BBB14631.1 putative L-lactate dehydrogenase [Candidatus Rickettsiella viridis]